MRWFGRLAAAALALTLLAGGSSGCSAGGDEPQPPGQLVPAGERPAAPAFSGELLGGGSFDSSALDGKIALVNVWASWCGPCRVEAPLLQEVYAAHRADGVVVVGINVKDDEQNAAAFVADEALTYPILFDPRSEVALAFDDFPLRSPPVTVVIDRAGRVAATYLAPLTAAELTDLLDQLLG